MDSEQSKQLIYDFVNMLVASLLAVTLVELAKYSNRKRKRANRGISTPPVRYKNHIRPPPASRPIARQWTPPVTTTRHIQPFFPARNDYLLSVPELQEGLRSAPPAYSE